MNGIGDEIRESFRKGTAVVKLIYINLGVFLLINILYVFYWMMTGKSMQEFEVGFLQYFMAHSDLTRLIMRPWTWFTYMFMQINFLHVLFNMLWLFWFGRIFLHYLTEKQLYTTYLLGGLSGLALYVLAMNVLPVFSYHAPILGASAAVTAIVIAISVYDPNYTVYIPFLGPVRILIIAAIFLVTDIIQIPTSGNAGGLISHLGGAVFGYLYAVQLKRGKDIGTGFNRVMDSLVALVKPRPKMKVTYKGKAREMDDMEYNKAKATSQKEVDRILDKIAKSGYDSLTKKEKETLFNMSNRQ